jgi:hypothetical protein
LSANSATIVSTIWAAYDSTFNATIYSTFIQTLNTAFIDTDKPAKHPTVNATYLSTLYSTNFPAFQ